ncbi:DNA primase [Thalassoporum mexicanum PCC 7367]|uniref:DNA primase n=1 Tax=Thalassoporum mexicanum TaxID=3457544 RepID=UPI00029FF427|nr:DNA primase [Pseudanabaena sp. PCC 7367]AFY71289.1 DNA primase [Pseudanabaena sp. PCC 7367]
MAGIQLHQDTIDEVSQRVDIVDVVSEYVVLRKSGKNLRGACPFHGGSNSSAFSVDPVKQLYHCFNCGVSGNAFKFLMEIGKQSFTDVVIDLARKNSISIRTLEPGKAQEIQRQLSHQERLYEIMAQTTSFFQHALHSPQGKEALTYLIEKRQLSLETIQKFQLGYAPPGWDTLHGYLVQQKRLPVTLIEQAGLIVPRKAGNGYYDRFRDRLMIPICDTRDRVIGFGGRSLGDDQPKYLNSPETELFKKNTILYGMNHARDAIAKGDRAIVVEGYFDAIALHQAGIKQAVATMGVALSENQVRQLLRYSESKRVVLNFDADQAGLTAAEKAIAGFKDLVFNGTVQLRVLTMPDGKDADEFLKQDSKQNNADAYLELLEAAPLYLDWQIDRTLENYSLDQADQFQKASKALTQFLNLLLDKDIRTHYIHICAQKLSQGNAKLLLQLEQDLRRQLRRHRWYGHKKQSHIRYDSVIQLAEMQILQIYLHFPEHRHMVWEALREADIIFSFSNHRHLWQMILEMLDLGETSLVAEEPSSDHLIHHLQVTCAELPELAQQLHHLLWLDENTKVALLRPTMVVRAAVAKIQLAMSEKKFRYLYHLWEKTDLKTNPELGHYYQTKIMSEKAYINSLEKQVSVTFTDLLETVTWEEDGYQEL